MADTLEIDDDRRREIDRAVRDVCPRPTAPVIGIVPMQVVEEHFLRLNEQYISAIVSAGGVPLILPLTSDKRVYERLFPMIDGFVLSGGQDIDPERYGETPDNPEYAKLTELTPQREEVEYLVLSYAYQFDVPTLGICRGMQVMNVFFGGTLYLDLADQFESFDKITNEPILHQQPESGDQVQHFVNVIRKSKLHSVLETDMLATNSFHHQGVRDLAPELVPAAYGDDGLIEAFEVHGRTFMMGVQWHPEFFSEDKHMGCLFATLCLEASEARRSGRLARASLHIDTPEEVGVTRFGDFI